MAMKHYRFADISFTLDARYPWLEEQCREYETEPGAKSIRIAVTEEEIDRENVFKEAYSRGYLESLAVYRKISEAAIECQNKQVILSTGMSTIDEVKYAINVLQQSKDTSFTVLHCNTQYPTEPEDMNLLAMNKLQELAPDWKIGLSDHSEGIVASLVAVGLGAKFIEKHFTLDKAMPGPDHKASITPEELKELCVGVHKAEIMLGNETKEVTESERSNIFVARKSIVAKRKIMRGEMFSEENITCKRPGNGISPIHWYEVLGKEAEKDFEIDELISCKGVNREDE